MCKAYVTVRANKGVGYIYPFHAFLKSDVRWYAGVFVGFIA